MAELLLFQLYGPLASWGEPAVGEYRPSATHPGKSQIVGLLGAALGLTREQEPELAALVSGYGLAVRIDAEGELLRDFQTVTVPPAIALKNRPHATRLDEIEAFAEREKQNPKATNPILSWRDYRTDASWTCALWINNSAPHPLGELAQALRYPRFVLYLGRKSCSPALPLNPKVMEAHNLRQAFDDYPMDERLGTLPRHSKRRYIWEMPMPAGLETGFTAQERLWVVPRRDLPGSRRRWQFTARDEHHAMA